MTTPKKDGKWQDSDSFETDIEYQDMYDDNLIDFLSKENPELLDVMKRSGLKDDDAN